MTYLPEKEKGKKWKEGSLFFLDISVKKAVSYK